MLKKSLLLMIVAMFLTVEATTTVHAVPLVPAGQTLEMLTYWLKQSDSIWGCKLLGSLGVRQDCTTNHSNTIWQKGCALSSMAMLYQYYGISWIPDTNYKPDFKPGGSFYSSLPGDLTPGNLNDWLVGHNGYVGRLVDWDNAVKSLYYNDWPEEGDNTRLRPNYICSVRDYPQNYSYRNAKCYKADWSDPHRDPRLPSAEALLDYDLEHGQPDILKMSGTDLGNVYHDTHFVLVAGYDPTQTQYGNLAYKVYDPGKSLPPNVYYQIPIPLTKFYKPDFKPLRVYRFEGWNSYGGFWNRSAIQLTAHSPVEMQLIDPMNRKTGFDPDTGAKLQENPMSLYIEEEEPSSLDGEDDISSEPVKILSVVEPAEGSYILKIIGTGDGPYTIDIEGMASDGTTNLSTSLTGTATASLYQTYRVTYSPTGGASISQANQAPVANAGSNQTGEQSYVIALDGIASSDPDGDPMTYTWSFTSKPNGSGAALSDTHAIKPTFTPDLPGTYVLQLIVNDHFIDSVPSTVTVIAIPVKSRISVTPNFSSPLSAGSSFISFDVNNLGRVSISSGTISISLTDPNGATVSSGSQTFSIGVGGATTVNVPVSIPSLKLGNYSLTYTQSDETRTGSATSTTISNSYLVTFSFDKITYTVRDTANVALNLINTGKFNLEGATLTLTVPDVGYTNSQSISVSKGQTLPVQYAILIPSTVVAGQHYVNATLALPSGSSMMQTAKITLQDSMLVLGIAATSQYAAGGVINLTVENRGSVDTAYTTKQFMLTDSTGTVLYQGNVSDSISAGERKPLADIQLPSQISSNLALLSVTLQDTKTGKLSYLNTSLAINGLQAGLSAMTDKNVYLKTEAITGITSIANGPYGIDGGSLKVSVTRDKATGSGQFTHFLPKSGWIPFNGPSGVAVASDGSVYVVDSFNNQLMKLDSNGNILTKWGSYGSGNGQFDYPYSVAVGPDGSVYVADSNNRRIQKFDSNGNYLTAWGGLGNGNGFPLGVAVGPDGSVYMADSGNYRVQKFNSNGNYLTQWGSSGSANGQFSNPQGVAVGPDGSVYVADSGNNRIQKFDSSGNFITKWGSYGYGNGQFRSPYGVAVGFDGSVYVVDNYNHRIQKFGSNGNYLTTWGNQGSGNGQFYYPQGAAVGSDGTVYVADSWNRRIQKFDSSGNFITKWGSYGNGNGQFHDPYGVAVGPDGSVYVSDGSNHRIQKFDSNGNYMTSWGSFGNGNGQFNLPYGVAVGPDGSVYVPDQSQRIEKFDSNGNYLIAWGSNGIGNGQFSYPQGVAVGSDGSVYVADSGNNRIQKFDSNGNYLAAWGSYGIGNGQFSSPFGVAVGPDGSVYVAENYNNRIQKFDSNGTYLTQWGSDGIGNGQFSSPFGVAVGPDGSVYVADNYNNRIQKFDSNGTYLTQWGSDGSDNGQFYHPRGVAVGPDVTVYVADTNNNRIQRKIPFSVGSEKLFEATLPVTQSANTAQQYSIAIGMLDATGKLYLQAELKNGLGQTIAIAEYPFYVVDGNTVLSLSTDKKIYKSGDTITITGQVTNLSTVPASSLNLSLSSQDSRGASQNLYGTTIDVPANGSYPFTVTTTAGATGSYLLTGNVLQNTTTLAAITDHYDVATPAVSATITGPDVVNRDPFNLMVQLTNTGKIDTNLQYSVNASGGNVIDSNLLTIPAGQSILLDYVRQINTGTIYTVNISGDIMQTVSKTVLYGETAQITIASGGMGQIYPEGTISFPVTVTNTGSVDESVSVTYTLSPSASNQTKTYYLPKGGSITDTLTYALTKGTYQLSASSLLPTASSSTSFIVAKDLDVAMSTTTGNQGMDGLIPVTVNLANSGYNDLNGTIALAVMNNSGKAVWRGEAQVSGLMSQTSMNYVINVDSTGIISGAYSTNITLYSSSGQQLAVNQAQVRVLGPIFEITSVPASPTFTVGKQAVLNFAVKNTGTLAGTASFAAKALDILNQSIGISLQPGEEKALAFNFTVPENTMAKDYLADYALSAALSQGTTGQAKFNVVGVNVGVTASLDKQVFNNNDTAVLTLTVAKQTPFEDGTYMAIIRYGAYHDMQALTLSSQPATLTFNVPLGTITRDRLFFGIYFESGTKIYQDSLRINTSPIVTAVSPVANDIYYSTIGIMAAVSDGGLGISMVQYQVDGGQWSSLTLTDPSGGLYSTIWTPTPADNGTHAVTFRATDNSGNMSLPVTIGFTVQLDTTPPTGSIAINNGAAYTNNTSVTLTLNCTDSESGCARMQFSNDNSTWSALEAYAAAKVWQLSSGDGMKNVYVKYEDGVGNLSSAFNVSIMLDTIPPVAVINGTPTNPTKDTAALLTVIGDDVITYKYRFDNGIYSAETLAATPITLTGLMDGDHLLVALGKDSAGNWQKDEHATVVTWTVDTEAPVLTLSILANGALTNNNTLNIAGTVTDNNGVSGVAINDTAVPLNADGTFSQAVSLITGSNTITTIAKDMAGNTTTDVRTISLDQSAPVVTITHPSDNSVTNEIATDVTGTVDQHATVSILVNGSSPVPAIDTDAEFSFPITYVYGQNTIEVGATDLAGNIGTNKRTVTLDNVSPALAVTNPAQDITTNESSIMLQGTVADLTITSVTITCDGITLTPTISAGSFEQQLTFIDEKTYSVVVTATDGAGNSSTVQRNIIYVKIPPPVTLYSFTGFFSPVDNPPYLNTANAGQAIPIKWRIIDGNGAPVSDPASFISLTSYLVNCTSFLGNPTYAIEEYASGSSGLLYVGDGNWHFNWKTPKTYAKQCRTMVLTLGDNSTHTAQFQFK